MRTHGMSVLRRAAVLLVAVALLGAPGPAAAQTASQTGKGTGSLDLRSQTTFRTPGEPFTVSLRVRTSLPTSTLEVAFGVYRRIASGRSEFAQTLEGRFRTRLPVQTVPVALDTLTPGTDDVFTVSMTPSVTREGVYPVRVELREKDSGDVLDGFVTHMVTLPAGVTADPLDVALIVPVHAPPATRADGRSVVSERWSEAIAGLATELGEHPTLPVTVAPTGETIEAFATSGRAADRETVSALARAVENRQVVAGTYAPTDLRALLDAGLAREVGAQLYRARSVVQRHLGVAPSATLRLFEERLDADALAAIEAEGVTHIVASDAALEPVTLRTTLTASFDVAARRGALTAAAADTALGAHFTRDGNPVLNAAHLLADLSVLWFDRPGRADERRGVVVLPPREWVPDARFDEALFAGLSESPILEPVTLDGFFSEVGTARISGRPLVRRFRAPETATGLNGTATRAVRRRLDAFSSAVEPTDAAAAVGRIERTLLVSMSTELRARNRAAYLDGAERQIDGQLQRIQMPQNRSITLTARKGELPITVTNRLPYAVNVVVELTSDTLDFSGPARREVQLARENTTETFAVRTQGSGSFPVLVRVFSPEGDLLLAESRFTVRSTAVSGVGVALSVGALAFLLLWWASHLRTRRREAGSATVATA